MGSDLIVHNDSLVVPDLHSVVTTASGDQAQIVCIISRDDLLSVAVALAATHCLLLGFAILIKVDLDFAVPAHRYYSMVLSSISNEGDLTFFLVMSL